MFVKYRRTYQQKPSVCTGRNCINMYIKLRKFSKDKVLSARVKNSI